MSGNLADDLSVELLATYRRLDLQPRELLALERAPTPACADDYWAEVALPRALQLVTEVVELLDRYGFGYTVAAGGSVGSKAEPAAPSPIRHLSSWWHRRLRRAALVRSIPSVLAATPIEAELVIARVEMALLDRAPWSHGDRLLSAFELAHLDIGRRLRGDTVNSPSVFRHA